MGLRRRKSLPSPRLRFSFKLPWLLPRVTQTRRCSLCTQRLPSNQSLFSKTGRSSRCPSPFPSGLRALLSVLRREWKYWGLLGNAYVACGDLLSAARAFAVSLRGRPQRSGTWVSAAKVQILFGSLDLAEHFLHVAIKCRSVSRFQPLSAAFSQPGHDASSRLRRLFITFAFRRADDASAWATLGDLNQRQKNFRAALRFYHQVRRRRWSTRVAGANCIVLSSFF